MAEAVPNKICLAIKLDASVKQTEALCELGNELFPYPVAGAPRIYGNLKSHSTAHLPPEHQWVPAAPLPELTPLALLPCSGHFVGVGDGEFAVKEFLLYLPCSELLPQFQILTLKSYSL